MQYLPHPLCQLTPSPCPAPQFLEPGQRGWVLSLCMCAMKIEVEFRHCFNTSLSEGRWKDCAAPGRSTAKHFLKYPLVICEQIIYKFNYSLCEILSSGKSCVHELKANILVSFGRRNTYWIQSLSFVGTEISKVALVKSPVWHMFKHCCQK